MTDTLHPPAASRFQLPGRTLGAQLFKLWPYMAMIFGALLLWHIGVEIMYGILGQPGVEQSARAENFAIKMTKRVTFFLLVLVIVRCVQSILDEREASLSHRVITSFKVDPMRAPRAIILFIIAVISFVWLQTNFMSVKTTLPDIQPFYLDEAARKWDQILFLGHDPYTLFAWLYDMPYFFDLIDKTYTFWAAIIAGTWVYCFVTEKMGRKRRYQYLISMVLLWFLAGNVFAIILSSAGPCYYGQITGDYNAYAGLMGQLQAIHDNGFVNAYDYQGMLWEMYENPNSRFGGISAMPSLHVGTSLMLLILFRKTPIARELLVLFNITIYIGSIILGWHYAVDGLISIPLVIFCWWGAGKLASRADDYIRRREQVAAT